jgi:hypothetical protein
MLRKPLGSWFPDKLKRRNWSTYYNAEHEVTTVFEEDNFFLMYKVHPLRALGMGCIVDREEIDSGPSYNGPDGIPADVNKHTNKCTTPQLTMVKEQTVAEPTTFLEYISTLPQWETQLLEGADQVLVALLKKPNGH